MQPTALTRAVRDAYGEALRLFGPMLAAHVIFGLVFAALLAPAVALALQGALMTSGKPALTDQEIAAFLLSPVGAVLALLVGALFLAVQVLGLATKMAIAAAERGGRRLGTAVAIRLVLARLPALVRFALLFVLRVLVFVLPAVAICGGIAWTLLTEFDINYYLSQRPPAFLVAVLSIGAVLIVMLSLLVPRLLSWAVALPMVLFSGIRPARAFAESAEQMSGRRLGLMLRVALILVLASGAGVAAAAFAGGFADVGTRTAGGSVPRMMTMFAIAVAGLTLLNLLIATLTSATFAIVLLEAAGWPEVDAPAVPPRGGLGVVAVVLGIGIVAGAVLGLSGDRIVAPSDVQVIAHRGGAADRPENTMAAMEHGIELGADWLEIDVQESADGTVIVTHDSDFMKQAGVATKVWDVTEDELAEIDIGSWFDPAYADARVPTLADVLALAKDRTRVLIELKYYGHDEALEQRVSDLVDAAGMGEQVAAMSLKPGGVAKMKALRPDWQVGLLAATSVGRLWEAEADFLAVNTASASPRLIKEAAQRGKPVYVWTVNDVPGMVRMVGLGVDGLITDRTGMARQVLLGMEDLSPAERWLLSAADLLGIGDDAFGDGAP